MTKVDSPSSAVRDANMIRVLNAAVRGRVNDLREMTHPSLQWGHTAKTAERFFKKIRTEINTMHRSSLSLLAYAPDHALARACRRISLPRALADLAALRSALEVLP